MGWTANSNRYTEGRRLWYCGSCRKRRTIELNPDWVAEGKPLKWDGDCPWSWFTMCGFCGVKQCDESMYDCPNCGAPSDPPEHPYYKGTMIKITPPETSYNLDGNYTYWNEQHKCRKCGKKWWFINAT